MHSAHGSGAPVTPDNDFSYSGVIKLSGFVFLVCVATFIFCYAYWKYFIAVELKQNPAHPMATQKVVAPDPKIALTPIQDYRTYREKTLKHLNGYGWVDQSKGIVHIPIEDAMKKMAEGR